MNKSIIPLAVGAAGLVSGFGLGYFVAKTRMEALMELRLKEEIESVKDAFHRGQKAGEYATPESAVNALIDPLEQAGLKAKYVTPSTEGDTTGEGFMLDQDSVYVSAGPVNVFDHHPVLVAGYPNPTDENAPYLITVDQFHQEHDDYDKNSIVWYAGDLVLADETEAEIHDIPNTVGADFAEHFGYMSLDANIVYYRNDRLGIDFEISFDPRTYAEIVIGLIPGVDTDDEPAESFEKTPRKPRTRVRDDRDD